MPPVGFEPAISTGERPLTYALDRAATGTGMHYVYNRYITRIMRYDNCMKQLKINHSFILCLRLNKVYVWYRVGHKDLRLFEAALCGL